MSFIDGLTSLLGSASADYPFVLVFVGSMLFLACSFNLFGLLSALLSRVGGFR